MTAMLTLNKLTHIPPSVKSQHDLLDREEAQA